MSLPAATPRPLRCWAEIDLAALERNLRLIRASLPAHIRYVAVVKADAYGHGLHHAAARLMHSGADLFAVANVTEAATEVGYNSLSHFSAAFHETFGCCPGLYPLKTPAQKKN